MKTISDYYEKEELTTSEMITLVILPIIKFAKKTIMQKENGKAPFPSDYDFAKTLSELKQIDDELTTSLFQDSEPSSDKMNIYISKTNLIIEKTNQYLKNKSLKDDFKWMHDTLNNIFSINIVKE